jgi:hypothetical protein
MSKERINERKTLFCLLFFAHPSFSNLARSLTPVLMLPGLNVNKDSIIIVSFQTPLHVGLTNIYYLYYNIIHKKDKRVQAAMAFLELKRLQAKIRKGDAVTEQELERYRQLASAASETPKTSSSEKVISQPTDHLSSGKNQNDGATTNGTKRLHAPVPVGQQREQQQLDRSKRQKVAPKGSHHLLVGILRNNTKSISYQKTKIGSPTLKLDHGSRESSPHQYQQFQVRVSPSESVISPTKTSAFVTVDNIRNHQLSSSPPLSSSSREPFEEAAALRRMIGMRSTTAMLAQTLPPSLSYMALAARTDMSTTHILRRLGNPHRRVVHRMLREQHSKILTAMKAQASQFQAASCQLDSKPPPNTTAGKAAPTPAPPSLTSETKIKS